MPRFARAPERLAALQNFLRAHRHAERGADAIFAKAISSCFAPRRFACSSVAFLDDIFLT